METTVGPHSNPEKSLSTGRASHISAASENGPRFDPSLTPEQRRSIKNGIWLCTVHADIVDKDFNLYSVEELLRWKQATESFVGGKDIRPPLPNISLQTIRGLMFVPGRDKVVTGDDVDRFRDHQFVFKNSHSRPVLDFHAYFQFPERPVAAGFKKPLGTNVDLAAAEDEWVMNLSPGATVEQIGEFPPSSRFSLEIDKLLPGAEVTMLIRSIYLPDPLDSMLGMDIELPLHTFISGAYQSEWKGKYPRREFLVPLSYAAQDRTISSLPAEELGDRPRFVISGFGM
jgi:hypothetical protein